MLSFISYKTKKEALQTAKLPDRPAAAPQLPAKYDLFV
jgi:hypothetical protein